MRREASWKSARALNFLSQAAAMEEEVSMEYLLEQVMQKDLGKRLQVGQEIVELILDEKKSPDLEQDQTMLDRMVDAVASSWVNASNFKVRTILLIQRVKLKKLVTRR